jgi:hypothetical protein
MPSFRSLREKFIPSKKKKKKDDEFKGLEDNKALQKYNMKLAKEQAAEAKKLAKEGKLDVKTSPGPELTTREKVVEGAVKGVKKALRTTELTHEEKMKKSPSYRRRMKIEEERRKKKEKEKEKEKEERETEV